MAALHDLHWDFLFSCQMICKQHIILNHVFFRYESNQVISNPLQVIAQLLNVLQQSPHSLGIIVNFLNEFLIISSYESQICPYDLSVTLKGKRKWHFSLECLQRNKHRFLRWLIINQYSSKNLISHLRLIWQETNTAALKVIAIAEQIIKLC